MVDKKTKSRYNKTYYYKNRAKVLKLLTSHVICTCGTTITKGNLYCHKKTKKHQRLSQKLNQSQAPVC